MLHTYSKGFEMQIYPQICKVILILDLNYPGPNVINFLQAQLNCAFIILINLTFISMINTTSESLKAKKSIFQHFSFHEQLKFHA